MKVKKDNATTTMQRFKDIYWGLTIHKFITLKDNIQTEYRKILQNYLEILQR